MNKKVEQKLWLSFQTISRLYLVHKEKYYLVSKRRTTGKFENMNVLTATKLLNKSLNIDTNQGIS